MYGAVQAPGGSARRGALIGSVAGLGGGAGLLAGNAYLDSDAGQNQHQHAATRAGLPLGTAALGTIGGLRAGRALANALGVMGRKGDNPHDDLDEMNLVQSRRWLPSGLDALTKGADWRCL